MNDESENLKFINENQSVRSKLKILRMLGASTTPEGEKQLNLWDKKRWLVLEDFWVERISKKHADELIEEINADEKSHRQKAAGNDS